jgi:hypothetical protein
MKYALVLFLAMMAPAHAQWMMDYGSSSGSSYFRSPAERIAPYRFVFAWSKEERALAWRALDDLKDFERPCLLISFEKPNRCHPFTQTHKVTTKGNINYDALKPYTQFTANQHRYKLIGKPGYDDMLIGRTLRVQEDMKSDATYPDYLLRFTGALALGTKIGVPRNMKLSTGELIPRELSIPEAVLLGHAMSRYYCRPEEQDADEEEAKALCDKENSKSAALVNEIKEWAQKP